MKFSKILSSSIAATILLAATSASAVYFNANRPLVISPAPTGEDSLQVIMDNTFGVNSLSAANDQSNAAGWTVSDFSSAAFSIDFFAAAAGSLGIYSLANGMEVDLGIGGATGSVSFAILTTGTLVVNNTVGYNNFGSQFGFFWDANNNKAYTEDSKNNGNAEALTYELSDGVSYTFDTAFGGNNTGTAEGGNDWFIAFEDGTDNDFNDATFIVKDISAIPEPSIIALLGLGLVGMGVATRRKQKAA